MKAPLYDDVHQLSIDIVNASAKEDLESFKNAYASLKTLCIDNEGGDLDHPLQWEALGDFSDEHDVRLSAYEKGMLCARKLELNEYVASIMFAIAESFQEIGSIEKAIEWATQAQTELGDSKIELGAAIDEFLATIST